LQAAPEQWNAVRARSKAARMLLGTPPALGLAQQRRTASAMGISFGSIGSIPVPVRFSARLGHLSCRNEPQRVSSAERSVNSERYIALIHTFLGAVSHFACRIACLAPQGEDMSG